jgi:hypothetical protein
MTCVTFSRRGADWGNRRVSGLAKRLLRRVVACHFLLCQESFTSKLLGKETHSTTDAYE